MSRVVRAIVRVAMKKGNGFVCVFILVSFFYTLSCSRPLIPERFHYLNYEGKVNQHSRMIKAKPAILFSMITDIEVFKTLYPSGYLEVTETTHSPHAIGTVRHTRTKYIVPLNWNTEVIEIVDSEKIVLKFLNGIFKGGYEIWELKEKGDDTEVSHTILYNVYGFFPSLVWYIKKGEKKHDYLIEETLDSMRRQAEVCTEANLGETH